MTSRFNPIVIIFALAVALALIPGAVITAAAAAAMRIEGDNTVVDQGGRSLTVNHPFERIISLYGGHTENLFSLGLNDEIIGVSRHEAYPPQALEKPVFSYREDPEKFLAARPDLVLIRPMIDRGYPQFVAMLEKNGIAIISLQPGTVEDMYTYWKILGLLSGRPQQADRMIARFRAAAEEFRSLTAVRAARKKVYFEAIHSKMKTFTPDSMAVFALEAAGGINIAADAEPVRNTNIAYYGKERILSRGREIDVYLAQSGTMNKPTIELITNEPGFNTVKAVAAREIYFVDEQIVSRPTMRLLDGIYQIGKILYPADFNARSLKILNRAKKPD
ncbi:MAG: ABC transporter substrate-binding protein [Deltaproteobacteria bacterium]|jgi:iron complex transport system substrate-binding protein|nr:ABC transporter substrate-binding protein [Deltaproteobacteria bacterium]MBW2482002.1 ABC transporter substrate-binding protein [Deltaproteobacteria bacterium]